MLSMLVSLGISVLRMRFVIVVAIIAASIESVFADIAPDPLSGGKNLVVKGREKTSVAMVDEVVKLKLSKDVCQVDVVFTMKNTSSTYETMQVGFPHDYPGELRDFKASVQGKPVKFKSVKETSPDTSPDGFPTERTTYWDLWETTFPPGQPVKIAVTYSTKMGERSTWTVSSIPIAHRLTELVAKDDQAALQKQLVSRNVTYILRTGSHWLGPIGRCRIEVTFDGMTTENVSPDSLVHEGKSAVITRDKLVWDLSDYEPKQDLRLTITPEITRSATLKLLEKFQKQHPYEPTVAAMLFEYLVAAKRQPEAEAMLLALLKHWEDKIVIWGPDSERGRSLRQSTEVFLMIDRLINKSDEPAAFQNSSHLAPVIQAIALRVQDQMKSAGPNQTDRMKLYAPRIDAMLEWCRTHSEPK